MLTTSHGKSLKRHEQARGLVAPRTIPSNFCLFAIFSYLCGRSEAKTTYELNRLCRRARDLMQKPTFLNFFVVAPIKLHYSFWSELDPASGRTLFEELRAKEKSATMLKLTVSVPLERLVQD